MRKKTGPAAAILATLLLMACQGRNQSAGEQSSVVNGPPSSPANVASGASSLTDQRLGQWNGPEGTYILLSSKGDKYEVRIQSLDGAATYEGVPAGDRIQFQRDGKTESIRAGSGEETGMKWLLDKKNCLIIKVGEGFCRD